MFLSKKPYYGDLDYPEGPSTQYLRILVPNTIESMVFGTRDLKYWVLGPSGLGSSAAAESWCGLWGFMRLLPYSRRQEFGIWLLVFFWLAFRFYVKALGSEDGHVSTFWLLLQRLLVLKRRRRN